MEDLLRIGVVGYSVQQFDEQMALEHLREAYDTLATDYPYHQKVIVSGLTALGIPLLAYQEAVHRCWKTVGIACAKAADYPCFPVDEKRIVGEEWGEESAIFLDSIDVLLRIGGGKQSQRETAEMKARGKRVLEYELLVQK